MKRLSATVLTVLALAFTQALPARAGAPDMTGAGIRLLAQRIVPAGHDAPGWAADVHVALDGSGIRTSRSNVCSVLAVIGQESNFIANPQVKGLGPMAEGQIRAKLARLPVLPEAAAQGAELFLTLRPSHGNSYLRMIRTAKTERDLDLVYRNIVYSLFSDFATTRLLNSPPVARRIDAENPVATLGAMQVSAAFAIAEVEKRTGRHLGLGPMWKLRDELYTRRGGVAYGTRMLLGYRAGYASRLYVFADYNAGRYASRNAAFQLMVAELSGQRLALDGDLMLYEGGKPKPEASATERALRGLKLADAEQLRADLLLEKEDGFRSTETYARVAKAFTGKTGKEAPYAVLPQIELKSPKIRHHMTTADFARAVMRRYESCMTK